MREGLRKIPEGLAGGTRLLGVEPQMICVAEHLLEEEPGLVETAVVRLPGAGQSFDQPEAAEIETALDARKAVVGVFLVIAVDETVLDEAPFAGRTVDGVDGREHARVGR